MMMIERIQPYLDIARRRRTAMVYTLAIGVVVAGLIVAFLPKTYQGVALVLIVSDRDGRDPSVSSIDLPSVATSTAVLEGVQKRLNLSTPLIELKKHLKASVSARSSIMQITYRDKSPDQAVAVPNALADELSRYYEHIATSRSDEDVAKLDTEIKAASDRLRSTNRRLSAESARHPFLNSSQVLDTLTARIDTLSEQEAMAEAQLQSDEAVAQTLTPGSALSSKIARREILQGDAYYQRIAEATARDQAALTYDRSQYKERFPGVHTLSRRVAIEEATMKAAAHRLITSPTAFSQSAASQALAYEKAEAVVTGDRDHLEALRRLISTEDRRLVQLPKANAAADWLRIQRDAAQSDYLTLSSRRSTALANRAEALSLGSVVVFDRAVKAETAKVGLGKTSLAVIMLILAIVLAIVVAFALESIDVRLVRGVQIEKLYGVPLVVTLGREV